MPHWDFRCITCGSTVDRAFSSHAVMVVNQPTCERCGVQMEKQPCAPAFRMAAPAPVHGEIGGIKTTVSGDFNAF